MSDARMVTWADSLPKNPCSVLDVRALFQLPPTSKHPRMGLPVWPHCLTTGNHAVPHRGTGLALAGVPMPALSMAPNHVHDLLPKAPAAHTK